jgi:HEAT repeat protein
MMAQSAEDRQGQHEDQIGPLMALLRDGSRDNPPRGQFPLRRQGLFGLVALGAAAVEPLCLALQDKDGYTRRFAAEALAEIGDPRAVAPLIIALQESEEYVQRYVAGELAKLGDARAVAPLYAALGKPQIAQEALQALRALLERTAGTIPDADLRRVASLEDRGRAVVEVADTDGGYLAWNQVEEWLDCRPVKRLAQQELARRGLAM